MDKQDLIYSIHHLLKEKAEEAHSSEARVERDAMVEEYEQWLRDQFGYEIDD